MQSSREQIQLARALLWLRKGRTVDPSRIAIGVAGDWRFAVSLGATGGPFQGSRVSAGSVMSASGTWRLSRAARWPGRTRPECLWGDGQPTVRLP